MLLCLQKRVGLLPISITVAKLLNFGIRKDRSAFVTQQMVIKLCVWQNFVAVKTDKAWQWLRLSCRDGHFLHKRSEVQIESLANF